MVSDGSVLRIDDALNPVRAAISLVASGSARRVTVHGGRGRELLPAARLLGRAAGVRVEPIWWDDEEGCDLAVGHAEGRATGSPSEES